jgi:hypothetical protein
MSYQPPPSSDDALYALLGIPSTSTRTIEPIIHNTSLTRSTDSRSAAEVDDTETITRSEKKKKKTKRGGAVSRLRRTTEREAQRIALGEDSDEAIKDTAHTRVTHLADSRRPSDDKVEKKLELPQVNPYWMYGQGLEIPPYRASIKEEMKEEVKVEGDLGSRMRRSKRTSRLTKRLTKKRRSRRRILPIPSPIPQLYRPNRKTRQRMKRPMSSHLESIISRRIS